ncbi:MAG TPA: ATP-binding protein [Solirubrobacteraceae bacterium]|nr:ATP-binding protein [Solirubrobacteraceae bacterium]
MTPDPVLASLRAAVEATPEDIPLRLHFAEVLAAAGARADAVRQAGAVLQRDPENLRALRLITGGAVAAGSAMPDGPRAENDDVEILRSLESELTDVLPPMYVDPEAGGPAACDVESPGLRLADVAGMGEVKARLEAGVLAPMRHPEFTRLYGRSLNGGLLLYGPPGCGKTFIARALAGEMKARFVAVSLADVLDVYLGQSERNIREIFELARRRAPCVVFMDEIDALGQKRGHLRSGSARGTVNQLLSEMDGMSSNEGVYVIGATNHPWDVDVALRRPGRFDRMQLVLPPDAPARAAVLRYHLRGRPIANVDVHKLAELTDGYSGADLACICDGAAEHTLLDSVRSGAPRMIEMEDLLKAVREVKPSIDAWLATARNVAQFSNEGGSYDDLLVYLRRRGLA